MQISPETLLSIGLLSGLGSVERIQLFQKISFQPLKRNETIIRYGESDQSLFFLFAGQLKVTIFNEDGHESGFLFLEPGAHVGEMALIDYKPRSVSVITTRDSVVGKLGAADAANLVFGNPSVSQKLMQVLVERLRQSNQQRVLLSHPRSAQRVLTFLLQSATPTSLPNHYVIQKLPTQQDISVMTDTSRETVSKTINLLAREGMIRKEGRLIWIDDFERLTKVSLQ